ncbi:hypothetical protein [Desulforhabdus sp. TSK]|uniref:hypothetical protein n=1 Tax=Desulforhabdus sp. TSK TaxID=2925014 RepID=UPI001FC855AA|nr:hypothetical protein [Desulforhabdus sp. TSK]GKT09379.1 hypothetical protein DSTSK_26840 [Desulforhabdus sp. TSK]
MNPMNQNEIFKSMLQFNKTVFENTYNAITLMQDQAEKMFDSVCSQNSLLPKDGKSLMDEWTKVYKTGRESFKHYTDAAFNKVETFLSEARND